MTRSGLIKVGILAVLVGGIVLFFALGGQRYVDFETVKSSRDALLDYRDRHFAATLIVVAVAFAAATILSLPIATLLSLAIGLMFGRYAGTLIIALTGTFGATALLVLVRYVASDFLRTRLAGSIDRFDVAFQRNGFAYLALLRIVPIVPFWLVNLASAFTGISVRTYAAATFTGLIPISFVWASLGESLETIASPADLLSGNTLFALAALGAIGTLAIVSRAYLGDKQP
jgi:uncharacterized membrane protein YdjX (TVP38/TMEM64 family)